jgi:hypothetical protein
MKITNATKSIKVYEISFIKNFFKLEMLTMDAKNFIDGKLIYHCVPPLKKGRNQEENPAFDFCHVFEHAKLPRTKVILHCETRYSQSKKGDKKPRIHFKADILQKQRKLMNSYINGKFNS